MLPDEEFADFVHKEFPRSHCANPRVPDDCRSDKSDTSIKETHGSGRCTIWSNHCNSEEFSKQTVYEV